MSINITTISFNFTLFFFEGFGNVLIEALSFKLPCISTKTDGPREVLKMEDMDC